MNPNDERLGLVSASKFEMVVCCEGQPQLESSLRAQGLISERPADEMALRGTKIHKAWETGDTSNLSEDELEDLSKTEVLDNEALFEWANEKYPNSGQVCNTFKEQRLWLHDENLQPIVSGQFDRLTICGNHAYVRDLKSGWCKRLTPSQESWQLRLLAVLVWTEYGTKHGLETIRASFIKPKLKRGVDTVEYTVDDLYRSLGQIKQVIWRSKQPDAQRTAGDHCFYCKCISRCPQAASYALLPSVMSATTGDVSKKDVVAAVARLSPADWKYIWQRSSVIRNILDACNAQLKQLPKEQLSELGLQVGKGKQLDPISNTEGAFKFLEHQLPREVLWGCMKMNKSDLVDALHTQKGMTKKDAAQWVKDNLAIFIEAKESEGSLEEI